METRRLQPRIDLIDRNAPCPPPAHAPPHPRSRASQLPALLRRAERVACWHLGHACGHELARLPAHRVGAAPWRHRICRADPAAAPGAVRRRAGGVEPPPHARRHADPLRAAIGGAGGARAHPIASPWPRSSGCRWCRASSTPSIRRRGRPSSSRWSRTAPTCPTPSP